MDLRNNTSEYAERINLGNVKYNKEMAHLREEAKTEVSRLVDILVSEIRNIEQIWGFGSVFDNNMPFMITSDIDLALEGGDIISAIKITKRSSFKVDIIDITGLNDKFAFLIRENGKALL